MDDIRVQLHKAAFGPVHERSTVLLCAAIDEIERLRSETKRWHIKTGGAQELLICVGDHAKDAPCDFHRYRYVAQ